MGTQGASCVHTLSTMKEDIPEPEWDDVRFGMLCTSADNFADIKTEIEKLCSVSGKCTYDMKAQIKNFFDNVATLKIKAMKIRALKK